MPQASVGPRGDAASRVPPPSNKLKKGTVNTFTIHGRGVAKYLNRVQVASRHQRVTSHRGDDRTNFTQKLTGLSSTCPSTCRTPLVTSCRKSLSMVDLSPGKFEKNQLRSEVNKKEVAMGQLGETTSARVKSAGSLVCHALALNAWRRRREEVAELSIAIEKLTQQVEQLQLQIVVLRRLLETENNRVAKLRSEQHYISTQLELERRQKIEIISEKEKLENEVKKMQELSQEREVFAENLRNELLSVKDQLTTLESQMSKEREKLLKLREDKKILLEKVSSSDAVAAERGERAERAEKNAQELQTRLGAQVGIIDTLQGDKQKLTRDLKVAEIEKIQLEKKLLLSEESGKALSLRVENLEMQLGDREAALRRIEIAYNAQLIELNDLRERLMRHSQESGWSNRVLQIAGSVVRAPRAILRSLSLLSSNTQPSHP